MIELRLLGGVSLKSDDAGRDLTGILGRPKRLALLSYLAAASPSGLHSRDKLTALFWPETDQEHARAALRKTVHLLRSDLGESTMIARGDDQLGCNPAVLWCDVAAFNEALRAGQLSEALELYRGELLPGFFSPESPGFERWLEDERASLRTRAGDAARRCAKAHEHDAPEEAARYGRLVLDYAASDEPAIRWLMELLDRRGDRGGALRAYEQFAARLRQEFEVEPSEQTKAQADRLKNRVASSPGPPSSHAENDERRTPDQPPTPATKQRGSHVRLPKWLFSLPVIGMIVFGLAWFRDRRAVAAKGDHRELFVGVFENETGDSTLSPIGKMASDWLVSGLQQTGLLRVISLENAVRPEISRKGGGDAHGRSIAGDLGAGLLVSGRYYRRADTLTIQAEVIDVGSGETVKVAGPVKGPVNDPRLMVEELRKETMGVLAALVDPQIEPFARSASQPPSYAAYLEFAAGQESWVRGDMRGAVSHFTTATGLDSSYIHPLALAAMAYNNLGEEDKADSLIAVATRLGPKAPYDRALLDLMRTGNARDHPHMAQAAARLSALGDGGGTVFLMQELITLNQPREALEAARAYDPSLGWVGNTGWGFEIAAEAYHFGGDYRAELSNAQRGRKRFLARVDYLGMEARALVGLGRVDEVNRLMDDAWTYPWSVAQVADQILSIANELTAHGYPEASRRLRERAVGWLEQHRQRTCDPQPGDGDWCDQLSRALYESSRYREAADRLQSMPFDTTARGSNYLSVLGRLGALAVRLGNQDDAARISARLDRDEPSVALMEGIRWERARLAALGKDSDRAIALLRDACVRGCPNRILLHRDVDFDSIRHLAAFRALAGPVANSRQVIAEQ